MIHNSVQLALTIGTSGPSSTPFVVNPPGDIKTYGLNSIVQTAIWFLMSAAFFIALTYLIWGALDYILAEGDKQRIQQARQKFIFAIIGLVVVLLAFFIVGTVGDIFGINLFNSPFGAGNIQNPCLNKLPGQPC